MAKKRSCSDSFLKYGLVSIVDQGIEKLQCVLCMKVLSPESMKPLKPKRHLETKHTDCKDKDLSFFERKANCVKRSRMDSSGVFQQQNRAAVEATFHGKGIKSRIAVLATLEYEASMADQYAGKDFSLKASSAVESFFRAINSS